MKQTKLKNWKPLKKRKMSEAEENKVMVRNLFLTMLLLENLDEMPFTSLYKNKLKNRINSLKRELEIIPEKGFKALTKESALEHTEIYLKFSKKFDDMYEDFLKEHFLTDEG